MSECRKILRIMKCIIFLICLSISQVFANLNAQEIKVDVKAENSSFIDVINSLRIQTNCYFLFDVSDIKSVGQLNFNFESRPLKEVLENILKGTALSYRFIDNTVIIFKTKVKISDQEKNINVDGKVLDEKGNPIPGVSVVIKGTNVGVSTDKNGVFKLLVPDSGKKIVFCFSFIGMKEVTQTYQNKFMVVTMFENATDLDEVVITGYQRFDGRTNTSAIQSIKVSEILNPGLNSIDKALEGHVPEMQFMLNSGEVGVTPRIRIRGTSTLLGNREPLWVLDGFVLQDPVDVSNDDLNNPDYVNIIGNAIQGINPQDIERIDILKDASATALYGTKAANGVIVITTKKGSKGKVTFSYNHSSKFMLRPRYRDRNIDLMNSQERVQFGKDLVDSHYAFPSKMADVGYEGAWYKYQTGDISYDEFYNQVKLYESVNTDWFKILANDSYSQDHTLGVSGGSDDVSYYASIGYNRENSVTNTVYTDRMTARVNMNIKLAENFKLMFSLSGNVQNKNHLPVEINPIDYAYNTTRALPAYNEIGDYYYYNPDSGSVYPGVGAGSVPFRYNILNEIDNSYNNYNGNGMSTYLTAKYSLKQGFDINFSGSYSRSSTLQETWWGEKTNYVALLKNAEFEDIPPTGESGKCSLPYGGVLNQKNSTVDSWTVRTQADYRLILGAESRDLLNLTAGFEIRSSESSAINSLELGYQKDRGMKYVDKIDLEKYPFYKKWLNGESGSNRSLMNNLTNAVSGYISLSYSFDHFATINANGRMDYSNKFGSRSNEEFLPVWSTSAMLNIKEIIFKNNDDINEFRVRSSYGIQGNMLEDQSPNFIIKLGTIDPMYNEYISTAARYPNPNLRWEETRQFNMGADIGLLKNRLNLQFSYYNKKTEDAFTSIKVSSINGVNSYTLNGGDIKNTGYSISLKATPIKTKDFSWSLSTHYSANINKIKTSEFENYTKNNYLNGTALVNGESVGTFYSYKFLGLHPKNGGPLFKDYDTQIHLLKDKSIEETVKMVMVKSGNREPEFNGNFLSSFTYKSFSLSAMFTYSLGSKIRLFGLTEPIVRGIGAETNVRKDLLKRWRVPGDENHTNIPSIISITDPDFLQYAIHFSALPPTITKVQNYASSSWNMYDNSHIRVVDGDFLKCTSLNFRYSLSQKVLKNLPFKSAQISFNTNNLFTIASKKLKGQDPMQAGFSKPNLSLRPTYTFQLSVSF